VPVQVPEPVQEAEPVPGVLVVLADPVGLVVLVVPVVLVELVVLEALQEPEGPLFLVVRWPSRTRET